MGYRGTLILGSMICGIRPCIQYLKTKAVSSETSSPFASGQEFICSDQFLVLIFVNAIVAVSGSRPQFPTRETKTRLGSLPSGSGRQTNNCLCVLVKLPKLYSRSK